LEGFRIGQVIHTVKYADDLVLLAKKETVLQGGIGRLTEIGRCCGMEMNVEKPMVIRISKQPISVQMMIDQKQTENVDYFNYLFSMIANDAKCTREIKFWFANVRKAFDKNEAPFTSKLELNLTNKLVLHFEHSVVRC
jgi:hypothetical protein